MADSTIQCERITVRTGRWNRMFPALVVSLLPISLLFIRSWSEVQADEPIHLSRPVLFTQMPATTTAKALETITCGDARAPIGDGGRIVLMRPDGSIQNLTEGFHGACDPSISFDAKRVLFSGRQKPEDRWNVFELTLESGESRQITKDLGNCRSPNYQSTLYTIVSPQPWYQLTFVSDAPGTANESGVGVATHLYSCKLDGTSVRRLTYNLSSDLDPFLMADGRVLFAGWQRSRMEYGQLGRWSLFGINLDGADLALYAEQAGRRVKQMPCVTSQGLVVFVESDEPRRDGSGSLGIVAVRRPLHSYRPLTQPVEGLFHSPSPLPDGSLLVSRRAFEDPQAHAIYRLNPRTKTLDLVFHDPDFDCIQSHVLVRRREPDGRSSVVTEKDPRGKLYCLNVNTTDFKDPSWLPSGTAKRIRVLEGIPRKADSERRCDPTSDVVPCLPRRVLGEVEIEPDGSFHLDVPANTPIELQTVDERGLALRSCGWIWAKNHEPRGCIGCHEDGELTPENLLVDAMNGKEQAIGLPDADRRMVSFRRDIMPIVVTKCVPCHSEQGASPRLDGDDVTVATELPKARGNRAYQNLLARRDNGSDRAYVDPGRARTSPLMWHLLGRNTSRPWDQTGGDQTGGERTVKPIPSGTVPSLTDQEKKIFAEWVDLGATWTAPSIPGTTHREVTRP